MGIVGRPIEPEMRRDSNHEVHETCSRDHDHAVRHRERYPCGGADQRWFGPPLRFAGNTLKLNVKVHDGGSVRIGLLDEDSRPLRGRSVDDCLPIIGDSLILPVAWTSGSDVSARANKSTQIFVLRRRALSCSAFSLLI